MGETRGILGKHTAKRFFIWGALNARQKLDELARRDRRGSACLVMVLQEGAIANGAQAPLAIVIGNCGRLRQNFAIDFVVHYNLLEKLYSHTIAIRTAHCYNKQSFSINLTHALR